MKRTRCLVIWAVLLLATLCGGMLFAQDKPDQQDRKVTGVEVMKGNSTPAPTPMTRLAYEYTHPTSLVDGRYPRMCLAFSETGDFRLWRVDTYGVPEVLGGTLPQDEIRQVREMIAQAKLSPRSGIVRGFTTSFMVELPKDRNVERRSWVADRESPFPEPVSKLEKWLQNFRPQRIEKLNMSKRDVCPLPRAWPVEPSMAAR